MIDDRDLDLDGDTLSNIDEYNNCTEPDDKDTDGDGLEDNVETGTGEWQSISDTGTDPLSTDTDDDGLSDGVENPDLPYDPANPAMQPGTDPNLANSDGDAANDDIEIAEGTDPTDSADFPPFPIITIIGTGTASLLGSDLTDPENDADDSVLCCTGLDVLNLFTSDTADAGWSPGDGAGNEKSYDIFDNKVGGGSEKWCCNGPPQDVTIEFEEAMSLTHFTVSSANDVPDRDPRDWQILGSNDGIDFEPIFTQAGDPQLWTERLQVIRIDLPRPSDAYKFIRYAVTRTANANHQLGEIEYFGTVGNLKPFAITEFTYNQTENSATITWNSRNNKSYAVDRSTDMADGSWEELDDGVDSQGEFTSFTDSQVSPGADATRTYYRIREVN